MKRIYIYLSIFISLTFFGCDQFLEIEPVTEFSVDDFFENEVQVNRAVAGAYAKIRAIHNRDQWVFGEFRADNSSFQFNPNDRGGITLEEVDLFLMNSDNPFIASYWNQAYDGISRCNYVLKNIENVSFSSAVDKNTRKGEVLFLRSWFYFNLVQLYGDVPFVTRTFASLDEALSEEFTSLDEEEVVYDSIFNDIDRAIAFLPVSHEDEELGRATKGAAQMLKAKMHMARQEYAPAIPILQEIMTYGYELQDDYKSVFNPDNKGNDEMIFEIQYSFDLGQASDFITTFVPYNSGNDILGDLQIPGGRAGRNQPTEGLIKLYSDQDERKDVNIGLYITNNDTIPFLNKYNYPLLDVGSQDVNWPMYRYADALLMLAECLNETNGLDQNAIGLINLIRLRAGVRPYSDQSDDPDLVITTAEDLEAAIARERRLELAFENHRWFDLVRRGEAQAVMRAHGQQQKAEKGIIIPEEAYMNIRTQLAIPANEVQQFGYPQNADW